MFRLCYISTARQPITTQLCESILLTSRFNNERDGITGLLVAGHQRFLQALEGEEQAVRRTFERIGRDARHFACVVLEESVAERRQFPLWSMGFEQSNEGGEGLSNAQLAAALIAQIGSPDLRAQFEGFLALHWRSARAA